MNAPELVVTYLRGRAIAAYLHLPGRARDRSYGTLLRDPGLVVDLNRGGRPIGIEITAPSKVTLTAVNRVLRVLGVPALKKADLAPLHAA